VNVTAPVWTALLVSALGGALLTGVVSVGLRVLDLRHRNSVRWNDLLNEMRRDLGVRALPERVLGG
jgi:hypothetical protein